MKNQKQDINMKFYSGSELEPEDRRVIARIGNQWIELVYDELGDEWRPVTLDYHGCGCCGCTLDTRDISIWCYAIDFEELVLLSGMEI